MKIKGFTLAEILVALGVIGIIAAMVIPSIHSSMPDKDKGKVLKAYKLLNEINSEIFSDPSLYMLNDNCAQNVLYCIDKPLDKDVNTTHNNNNYEGLNKYPYLLAENMNLSVPISTSSSNYTFTTADGLGWTLVSKAASVAGISGAVPAFYTVTIDVGNPKRQACVYSTSCTNPGRFQFRVQSNGSVTAVDNLTRAYLMNPNNLSDRSADLQTAKNL